MTYIDQEEAELGALLTRAHRFLRRNRRVIFGAALGGTVLLGSFALTADKRYASSVLLMVEEGGASPNAPRDLPTNELLSFLDSQIHVIDSRDILQEVADRAGPCC